MSDHVTSIRYRFVMKTFHPQGDRGDKGDRGLTTHFKGDQFPAGIIEGPPGPPGPPGK